MPLSQLVAVKVAFSPSQQIVLSAVITGLDGLFPFLITTGLLSALVPHRFVHFALYVPATLTVITEVVEPLLHRRVPLHPAAVKLAVSLSQIVVLLAVTTGGFGASPFLISITFDASLTPQRFSQVAEYVPATLTVSVFPVAPVLHLIVPVVQPVAVNNAVSFPQIVSFVVVIDGFVGFTPVRITIGSELSLVPQRFVHFTVYVPDTLT